MIRSAVGTAVGRYYLALNKGRSYRDFMLANEGGRSRDWAKFRKVRGSDGRCFAP